MHANTLKTHKTFNYNKRRKILMKQKKTKKMLIERDDMSRYEDRTKKKRDNKANLINKYTIKSQNTKYISS